MDRAEGILDIFMTRARSSEAKMQVELRAATVHAAESQPAQACVDLDCSCEGYGRRDTVKSTEGKLLAEIHRGADALEQKSDGLDVVLRGLDSILMTHLRKGGASVTAAPDSPEE